MVYKKIFLVLILFIGQNEVLSQTLLLDQYKYAEKLKMYKYYIEIRSDNKKKVKKYYLKNGLVIENQNIENKKGVASKFIYYYDKNNNYIKGKLIMRIGSENEFRQIFKHRLTYNEDNLVIKNKSNLDWVKYYSEFNKLGKPQIIKTVGNRKENGSKEELFYDIKGNTIKCIKTTFSGNTSVITEIEIIKYKYDDYNNIIELHREYKPKREFPIKITDNIIFYEHEYYHYVYNDNKLWVKKTLFLEPGKEEILTWKREYK